MNEDEKIVLNAEQEAALGVMMSGANVFLTGEAGTGKSTLVREFLTSVTVADVVNGSVCETSLPTPAVGGPCERPCDITET